MERNGVMGSLGLISAPLVFIEAIFFQEYQSFFNKNVNFFGYVFLLDLFSLLFNNFVSLLSI